MSRRRVSRFFTAPWDDLTAGLDRCLASGRWADLARVMLGAVAGWFVYVPLHELLHALGCLAAGGTVTRLEIAPLYGGHLLERLFPFVVAGGDYAGRLAGFDTGGSDLVYLATDLAPFVLVLPGIWLLHRSAEQRRAIPFGLAVPFALAPFLSLTGDAYEIGSILVTRLPWWRDAASLLRSDDLVMLVEKGFEAGGFPWVGLLLATVLGVLWAFATYAGGRWLAVRSSAVP